MTTKRVLATNDHGGPIVLAPSDQVHPNATGGNFKVKKTLTLNLTDWPQLSADALEKYQSEVVANPNLSGVSNALLEHPTHAMSYPFPINESEYIAGFDVSKGGRAFTIYPRRANQTTNALERYTRDVALKGSVGTMRENHAQHVWIHPKGLPYNIHMSPHKHFLFASGAKITKIQIGLIVSEAVRLGVIYPPTRRAESDGRGGIRPNSRLDSREREAYEQAVIRSILIQ